MYVRSTRSMRVDMSRKLNYQNISVICLILSDTSNENSIPLYQHIVTYFHDVDANTKKQDRILFLLYPLHNLCSIFQARYRTNMTVAVVSSNVTFDVKVYYYSSDMCCTIRLILTEYRQM